MTDELYENFFLRIYNYARYHCKNEQEAEDLTSCIFEKLYKKFDTYNPNKASLEVWVFVIARSVTVDFVKKPEDFNPQKKTFKDNLFLTDLIILPEGKILNSVLSWTKGHILNAVDKTDSSYQIKQIDGETYLFFEWKSGDYTFRGQKPAYYVLERVKK